MVYKDGMEIDMSNGKLGRFFLIYILLSILSMIIVIKALVRGGY